MENVTQLAPGTLWARGVRGRSTDDGTVAGAGGGTGIDTNLTPPVLTLAVAGNVYPPQVDADLDVTWITGDNIRLQSCADISFGTLIIDDLHTITNAEVIAGSISYGALLSGIISPTVTWFRARGEHAAGNSNWSNICLHGDVTAPTITSSATANVNENTVLAHTLTANESIYSWTITGGLDSGDFEIAGTTLRWLGNGTKDYEIPDDSGTNNVYDVQVTATDYAGNATNQSIAVTVNDLAETPTGLSGVFIDIPGVTASTLATSAETYTVAGLGTTVPITITGGTYSKNGAAYTAGAGTVSNGDTVQLQATSSASSGAVITTVVTIGGGSDTWKISTAGAPSYPATGSRVAQFEASDSANLFQLITGATAATANNDPVGTWKDKNGNGFDLAAPANNTTRPTLQGIGTYPVVRFDRVSSQYLFRSASLGLYAAAGCTMMFSVRMDTTPAVKQCFASEGLSSASNPAYEILRLNADNNDLGAFVKDNAGTIVVNSPTLADEAIQNATNVVIILTDTGSSLTVYVDGIAYTSYAYTRGTSTGWDRFALGAFLRTTAEDFLDGDVYGASFHTAVLNSSEITELTTYGGYLQGRIL